MYEQRAEESKIELKYGREEIVDLFKELKENNKIVISSDIEKLKEAIIPVINRKGLI